eukprot:460708-Karenia_brevis.AAC.1
MRCNGTAKAVVHLSRRFAKRQFVSFVIMMIVFWLRIKTPQADFFVKMIHHQCPLALRVQ